MARRLALAVVMGLAATSVFGAGTAGAYLVHGSNGRLYGIWAKPNQRVARAHALGRVTGNRVRYWGGTVMLSTNLHLIFWGAPGQFAASYEFPIIQWAQDLATDSGKTTNDFSVGSLYYETGPRRQISRNVSFGGTVTDPRPYPANGCVNPANRHGVCLSDAQLQAEVARVIQAEHWPTDGPANPRNQYLIFTPQGVDSCQDSTETSCTFSQNNGYCAYHSSFGLGRKVVVYSNMPYQAECDSGQAPSGAAGNADADGTLDSAIHEVLESATDPSTDGSNDYGWTDNSSNEIGDLCNLANGSVYGTPLGGSLSAKTAFNQVIAGHDYYTQEIWAIKTPTSPSAGCVQRVGPSPVFTAPGGSAGTPVSFNATRSYDLVGRISTYIWDYGDGSPVDTTSGAHAVHVYAQPGVYQVTLAVEDGSGPGNASAETQTEVVK